MEIADMLLPEFDRETGVTRLLVERAPAAHLWWTPHPKAWTLGEICLHIAQLPSWGVLVMRQTAFDINPPDAAPRPQPAFESHAATLRLFDEHVTAARQAIAGASNADFLARWTLQDAGRTVFILPRVSVLRSFVLSHLIHHRGQLSVYLRICGVAVPPIYGPTADSGGQDAWQPAGQ